MDPNTTVNVGGAAVGSIINQLPMIVTNVMYMWSRAKAKTAAGPNGSVKPGYQTTEFWCNALVTIANLAASLLGVKVG